MTDLSELLNVPDSEDEAWQARFKEMRAFVDLIMESEGGKKVLENKSNPEAFKDLATKILLMHEETIVSNDEESGRFLNKEIYEGLGFGR